MSATLACSISLATIALAAPALARAQAAPELRSGRWAAEASVGPGGEAGNLLRFWSPTSAWLVGVTFGFERTKLTEDSETFPGEDPEETNINAAVGARLGLRRYAGAGAALRPISGVGVLGSFFRAENGGSTNESTSVGAYGELGAVYFFSSRVSLGAAGELRATYDVERFRGGTLERRATGFGVGGSVARVMATVYF